MPQTSPRVRSRAIITDRLGLHLRPATRLVVLARTFRSDIRVIAKGTTADARSLLVLDMPAHGPEAEEAITALTGLILAGFDGLVDRAVAAA